MNALVRKEVRLAWPAWAFALVLAVAPAGFGDTGAFLLAGAVIAVTLVAVVPLGRELNHGTLALLLVQPTERARIWRVKALLAFAVMSVMCALWLATVRVPFRSESDHWSFAPPGFGWLAVGFGLAAFSTGMWSTLVLRHVSGAIGATLLLPVVVFVVPPFTVLANLREPIKSGMFWTIVTAYSLGGLVLSRWLFLRAQDTSWATRPVELPSLRRIFSRGRKARVASRRLPGWWVLVTKELRLQMAPLLLSVAWTLLQLGLLLWVKFIADGLPFWVASMQAVGWLGWMVLVPVLAGALAIAEERSMGVDAAQYCLPVRPGVPFVIKLLAAGFVGTLVPVLGAVGVTALAKAWNLPSAVFLSLDALPGIFIPLGGALLLALYASSLSRNVLQTMGPFAMGLLFALLPLLADSVRLHGGLLLAHRPLLDWFLWPSLGLTLLVLTYCNQRSFALGWPVWRRNLVTLSIVVLAVLGASCMAYNRVWECYSFEPAHGPARLQGRHQLTTVQEWERGAWVCDAAGKIQFLPLPIGVWSGDWQPRSAPETKSGEDWTHVEATPTETVGLRKDGSLWSMGRFGDSPRPVHCVDPAMRFQAIAAGRDHFLALGRDGSLWAWGDNSFGQLAAEPEQSDRAWQRRHRTTPMAAVLRADGTRFSGRTSATRLDQTNDWSRIYACDDTSFGQKRDGSLWVWGLVGPTAAPVGSFGPSVMSKPARLDDASAMTWQAIAASDGRTLALHDDGSVWAWSLVVTPDQDGTQRVTANPRPLPEAPRCADLAGTDGYLLTLRGEIWQCRFKRSWPDTTERIVRRVSAQSDWVAISARRTLVALAADGSLVSWEPRTSQLLGPSRWPWRCGELLAAGK